MFALIDCNNFFVSCERLFRPELENRPVVVLSSNDGCAVSRSAEAKALGIPMGAPVFKYRELFRKHGVVSFSANFELYGDISQRLTTLLTRVTPRIEVYSVDESFLDLSELELPDYTEWGQKLRTRILQEIGIPVSVGIASTKTLAKVANHRAKVEPDLGGVLTMTDPESPESKPFLLRTPISEVWGVGWRLTPKLKAEGIHTAEDLRTMHMPLARQIMGKHGAQMITELNGISCLPLQTGHDPHKSIMRGHTLGQEVHDKESLQAAIATLTARAAYCLREEGLLVRTASLNMNTNKHKPGYQRIGKTIPFIMPTSDTGIICRRMTEAMDEIYRGTLGIYRVNILFHEVVPDDMLKLDLLGEVNPATHDRETARMAAFDAINQRYGKGYMRSASELLSDRWQPRKGSCSPRYSTRWTDLPTAYLGNP